MRIAFRVEGEPNIGLGHVMRCMALAQSLAGRSHKVTFFMSQRSQQFCCKRADWIGDIVSVSNIDKPLEPDWITKQCGDLQVDWLVLDGYQFDQFYRQALQSKQFKLAVFDDLNNSGALYADLVINGAPNAALNNYQLTAADAQLAIGQDYQVLRQEFLQVIKNEWTTRKNLTLMFGGSDPKKLTIKVLQSLQTLRATMPITVVTGAAYSDLSELAQLVNTSDLEITHLHDCQNMASVLISTQLAISAAGGSQFELLACAVPSILVVVAENQRNASKEASSQGWCQVVNEQEISIQQLAKQCLSLWQQPELLRSMHKKAVQIPVIDGAQNIVKLMSAHRLKSNSNQ